MSDSKSPSNSLSLLILKELVPDGFGYGVNLLVEFDAKSLWYEISLTIAADAVRNGIVTDYHVFQRNPTDALNALAKRGIDVEGLQREGKLRVIDSYTVQLGLQPQNIPTDRLVSTLTQSVKLADWRLPVGQEIKSGAAEAEKRRLHIDDNTSILLQYNDEKQFIEMWRTRSIPIVKTRELAALYSLVTGVYSDQLCRQWEMMSDGVIEVKALEKEGNIEHMVRVASMRGQRCDSRWRRIQLLDNGQVTLSD
jgi:KaiC/GvpD/RAD55 family RecA-like ATPase